MFKNSLFKDDLPSLSIRRPVLILVINLLIVTAGIAALYGLEVRELPDVDRPIITVSASYPGAAPETVDSEVTSRLEGAVARVSGVKTIRANSEEGSSRVRVEFRPGINIEDAANETRESVSRIQRRLPNEVENISVIKADNDAQSVVNIAISSSKHDLETLTDIVETDLAPLFLNIPGVADVNLDGDRQRVLRVSVDNLRLASFQISISDVAAALATAPFDVPAGSIRSTDQELIVRADASSVNEQDVRDIVIKGDVRIGDVANVYFGPADLRSIVRLDGKPVIGLGIIRQARSNTIEISDEVLVMVEGLRNRFPDLEMTVTSDDAEFIRDSVDEVLQSLLFTIALVIITLWVFIGKFRATLIPALAIPVSLIGSLAILWALGFSLNILTLLALVLATGLIVDDAIVVSENIHRRRAAGMGARAAAVIGTREVFFAVVATTAVLVAVFVPIAFLPSTAGRLFREFGGVLAGSVIISSFVALSLVPALTAKIPAIDMSKQKKPNILSRFGTACVNGYERSLHFVLRFSVPVVVVCLLVATGSYFVFNTLENQLLPTEDRGVVRIFARGPDGTGVNFMDRQALKTEELLLPNIDQGEIASIYTVVGRWDPNVLFITVPLVNWEDRQRTQQQIIDELRPMLSQVAGAPGRAFGANSLNLRGFGGGFEMALTGDNYFEIYQAALEFAKNIEDTMPELGRVEVSYEPNQPQLRINIDRRRAEQLGVEFSDISRTLRAAINGDDIVDLNVGDQAVPIILQTDTRNSLDPSSLLNLYVSSKTGGLVPLSSVAYVTEEGVAAELERHAQRRAIELEMDLPAQITIEQAVTGIRELANNTLPAGIGVVFLGEAQTFQETNQEVMLTYILAFLIVLLVLAAQFESFNSAFVVMLTVPFGIAAAIYALYFTGTTVNIYSQIGLVMLIGLLAKNSILLVEFANQLRDQGMQVKEAIIEAGKVRLRPIMMTLVSTILGGLPLILSSGAGAEARNAIGWVVFGGLGLAVVFTLFLTPVLYYAFARLSKPKADEAIQLNKELEAAEQQI
ncbi:MAG: hydrophobe/amphiphile efflux-1 (HAE1) family protein [Gammaproteobacteria bacterium]|jgi:hydrophobe/amphiphile efflux-1 (HAE1) family protein